MANSGFIFGLASLLAVAALCLLFLYIFVTTQRNVILRASPKNPLCVAWMTTLAGKDGRSGLPIVVRGSSISDSSARRFGMTRLRLSSYILFMDLVQLFFGKLFHIDEAVARSFDGPDDLIQLQMHGFTVTGLGSS